MPLFPPGALFVAHMSQLVQSAKLFHCLTQSLPSSFAQRLGQAPGQALASIVDFHQLLPAVVAATRGRLSSYREITKLRGASGNRRPLTHAAAVRLHSGLRFRHWLVNERPSLISFRSVGRGRVRFRYCPGQPLTMERLCKDRGARHLFMDALYQGRCMRRRR